MLQRAVNLTMPRFPTYKAAIRKAKRYGFIYVDRHDDGTGDFSRSKKDSFYWYKKVCESNGADLD